MRAFRFAVGLAALVVAATVSGSGLADTSAATAGPPMLASGTDFYTLATPSSTTAGTNTIIDFTGTTDVLSGTFTGSGVYLPSSTFVLHADGSFQFSARDEWTGTVAGCGTGTIVFQVEASAFFNGTTTWSPHFHWTALYGQGTLPVRANLDMTGVGNPGGQSGTVTYSGNYSC